MIADTKYINDFACVDKPSLVFFLVDARNGLSSGDYMIADYIRKNQKKVVVVANKIDGLDPDVALAELYAYIPSACSSSVFAALTKYALTISSYVG